MPKHKYCRNKRGGKSTAFEPPKPTVESSSFKNAVNNQQQKAIAEADLTVEENKVLSGGSNPKFTPMSGASDIQNKNNKMLMETLWQSKEDGKYDNPPKVGGGNRRKKRKTRRRRKSKKKRKTRKKKTKKKFRRKRKTRKKKTKKR